MKLSKRTQFYIFSFVVVILAFYAFVNIIDWRIPFFNPPEKPNALFLSYYYPPTGVIGTINPNTIYFEIDIKYTGLIVEKKPLTLEVAGSLNKEFSQNISSISVGFSGALPYEEGVVVKPLSPAHHSVSLRQTNVATTDVYLGSGLIGEPIDFQFPIQGDYPLVIVIMYRNFTSIQQDTGFKLHVDPTSSLRQERTDRVNNALSIALFWFAAVESLTFLGNLWQERERTVKTSSSKRKK